MQFKRPIYKFLFFGGWILLLGGITTLLIAANGKSMSGKCTGVEVTINSSNNEALFIQKNDVLKSLEKTVNGSLLNKKLAGINLGLLEQNLEKNAWIGDAELYVDTKSVLHVKIEERKPFARIFNTAGQSFYVDSTGYRLPLLDNFSVELPVVTGFTAARRWNAADSAQWTGVKKVVTYINGSSFWSAQVGQIDVTPAGIFELHPAVGQHVIRLGNADAIEKKLNNCLVFYKQVMAKAGLAKYSVLDLQFEGQVVAVKRGMVSAIDSVQLQKNIEELMARQNAEQEPAIPSEPTSTKALTAKIENNSASRVLSNNHPISTKTNANPLQSTPLKTLKKPIPQKPKAVMPGNGG